MGTLSIDVPSRSRLDLAGFTGRTMAVAVGACLEASMECLGTLLLLRVVGLGLVASVIACAHPFVRDSFACASGLLGPL